MTANVTEIANDASKSSSSRRNKKNNDFKKAPLRGNIEELGTNVCSYGNRNQAECCVKITEAVVDCVGRECSKEMRTLVKDVEKSTPQGPKQPAALTTGKVNPFEMEKCKKKLSRCCEKLDKCNDHKTKVFVVLKGQCTLTMKNKVESSKEHKTMESNDDVVALLKTIEELSCSTGDVHCSHWRMSAALKKALNARQNDKETITACCERFVNLTEIAEVQWGQSVPMKLAE